MKIVKDTSGRVAVSEWVLVRRVNRKLKYDDKAYFIRKVPEKHFAIGEYGPFEAVGNSYLTNAHINLEDLARELDVLNRWEFLNDGGRNEARWTEWLEYDREVQRCLENPISLTVDDEVLVAELLKLDTEGDFSAWIADLRCRLSAAADENDKQSLRECFAALASMIRTVHVFKAEYGELFEYMCAVLRDPASYSQEHVDSIDGQISPFETLTPAQEQLLRKILAKLADVIGKIRDN